MTLYQLAWRARVQNMDLRSSAAFTRIDLSIVRGEIKLRYQRSPDTAGVAIHTITSGEFGPSWRLA